MVVVAFFIVNSGQKLQGRIPHLEMGRLRLREGKYLQIIAWKESQNNFTDRVQSVLPNVSTKIPIDQIDSGKPKIKLQGYIQPNSAFFVSPPLDYTAQHQTHKAH